MTHWKINADNLSKAGWSLGWVSTVDSQGRAIWIVDAHGYGKRFVVRADEKADSVLGTRSGDSRSKQLVHRLLKRRLRARTKP